MSARAVLPAWVSDVARNMPSGLKGDDICTKQDPTFHKSGIISKATKFQRHNSTCCTAGSDWTPGSRRATRRRRASDTSCASAATWSSASVLPRAASGADSPRSSSTNRCAVCRASVGRIALQRKTTTGKLTSVLDRGLHPFHFIFALKKYGLCVCSKDGWRRKMRSAQSQARALWTLCRTRTSQPRQLHSSSRPTHNMELLSSSPNVQSFSNRSVTPLFTRFFGVTKPGKLQPRDMKWFCVQ